MRRPRASCVRPMRLAMRRNASPVRANGNRSGKCRPSQADQAKGLARAVVRSGGHAVGASDGPALVGVMLDSLPRPGEQRSPIALE